MIDDFFETRDCLFSSWCWLWRPSLPILFMQNNVTTQTTHQITSVVLVSGLIGIVSMIFEVDVIPITWEILIHFCLVYGLNSWLNMLIGTTTSFIWSLPFLGEFFLTYLIIWLVIYISFNHRIKNINQKLHEKTKK